jgi:hypothetical protein
VYAARPAINTAGATKARDGLRTAVGGRGARAHKTTAAVAPTTDTTAAIVPTTVNVDSYGLYPMPKGPVVEQ